MYRQKALTRRGVLTIPPIVTMAMVLTAKPAYAKARTIECLADIEVS